MRARHLQRRGNNGAVAKVDAIEITHRNHRSLGDRGRGRGVADNSKAGRHSWNSSKKVGRGRGRWLGAPDEAQAGPNRRQSG